MSQSGKGPEAHKATDWESLRQELLAEGKADLVDALDQLIRESHSQEAARILKQITSRLDGSLRL
ncbi:hypothetical protein [Roseibium suaedae]|uniref:Uncharacterized protein n=1 Tax=Roseibium suaedae TaxID=735517 RepID=A0A1M7C2T7_9HYPH|nr:hypothetical protein [Roseibium suaedae]SHL61473.1 hypothetical protein SAMN05444272_1049 [Roseibium suaedae]